MTSRALFSLNPTTATDLHFFSATRLTVKPHLHVLHLLPCMHRLTVLYLHCTNCSLFIKSCTFEPLCAYF